MSAPKLAMLAVSLFLVLLGTVHVLKSDVDPSWHFISEYSIGRYGWFMQAAFLVLAASNAAVYVSIKPYLRGNAGTAGSVLFLLGTMGTVMGGVFNADPMNTLAEAQTTSGKLHNLGGALGLLGFIGTVIMSANLLHHPAWHNVRKSVVIATFVLVLGFLTAFISITVIASKHQGVFGPTTPIGWPNRIGIIAACVWILIVALKANQIRESQTAQQPT
jgi:hypothetical protein